METQIVCRKALKSIEKVMHCSIIADTPKIIPDIDLSATNLDGFYSPVHDIIVLGNHLDKHGEELTLCHELLHWVGYEEDICLDREMVCWLGM